MPTQVLRCLPTTPLSTNFSLRECSFILYCVLAVLSQVHYMLGHHPLTFYYFTVVLFANIFILPCWWHCFLVDAHRDVKRQYIAKACPSGVPNIQWYANGIGRLLDLNG